MGDAEGGYEAARGAAISTRWLVVFGCTVAADGTPSAALARRLQTALAAYRQAPAGATIVVSGGAVRGRPVEASVMAAWLQAQGVSRASLVEEPLAQHTLDNARYTARLLAAARPVQVLLVTERYHMARSLRLLRRALLDAGLTTDLRPLAAPDGLRPLSRLAKAARETLASWRDSLALRAGAHAPR